MIAEKCCQIFDVLFTPLYFKQTLSMSCECCGGTIITTNTHMNEGESAPARPLSHKSSVALLYLKLLIHTVKQGQFYSFYLKVRL